MQPDPAASGLPVPLHKPLSLALTHSLFSLGDYESDVSPYEDTVTTKPWKMNLSKLKMLKPGVEDKPGMRKGRLGLGSGGSTSWGALGKEFLACCIWMESLITGVIKKQQLPGKPPEPIKTPGPQEGCVRPAAAAAAQNTLKWSIYPQLRWSGKQFFSKVPKD